MPDVRDYWPQTLSAHRDISERLLEAYADPGRAYHNVLHLHEVFGRIDAITTTADGGVPAHTFPRDAVLLGAWFHDAVYDAHGDNEERSAVLAGHELGRARVDAGLLDEVLRLVRLTATHRVRPDDLAGQVLCDADLGVLAADETRYAEYTAGVRREYQHVPDDDFRVGRAIVLRNLVDAPTLFHTTFAIQHWEVRARENVERELRRLEGPRR